MKTRISNTLFPNGYIVSGTRDAVEKFLELVKLAKPLQARIVKVGGDFHNPLMEPVAARLGQELESMLPRMQPPKCAMYFNRSATKVRRGADPKTFISLIRDQISNEACWEEIIRGMINDGVQDFIEVGPLKQLRAMLKRIDQDVSRRATNIAV